MARYDFLALLLLMQHLFLLRAGAHLSLESASRRALAQAKGTAPTGTASTSVGCGDELWASGARRGGRWSCQSLKRGALALHWRAENASLLLGITVWHRAPPASGKRVDWVGVGLSEAGGMHGADIALLRRVPTSKMGWVLEDRFSTEFAQPLLDAEQDKTLESVEEDARAGVLRAVVRVPLEPCDTRQDHAILPGIQHVIWAFGTGPFAYHGTGNRGDATIAFVPDRSISADMPTTGTTRMNWTMPWLQVPTDDSDPYVCVIIEIKQDKPMHVVGYRSLYRTVLRGSNRSYEGPPLVHHLVTYNCSARPPQLGKGPFRCESWQEACQGPLLASGSVPYTYNMPRQAGFRVGPGGIRYVMLQIHYKNVVPGLLDATGLEVVMTSQLRPHDMGVFVTGSINYTIPARTPRYELGPLICPAGCTKQFTQPINMVGAMLHMHRLGTAMVAQHVRNGSELRPFARRSYYDYGFQPAISVAKDTRVIRPGDMIVTTCTYANPGPAAVLYGQRQNEEMCYGYTFYWPLSGTNGIDRCLSVGPREVAMPVCGNTTVGTVLNQMYADAMSGKVSVQAALATAVSKGWVVPVDKTAAMAFKPFDATPAACKQRRAST